MFLEIKNKIDQELPRYIDNLEKIYSLNKISPLLFKNIKEFSLRPGKRVRPALFVTGYLGFSGKVASGLYASAISIELLHDFLLIHDDIIDRSDTRRGKPSMHALFNQYLSKNNKIRITGQDMAIVAGDVMYALAINAFLSIKENPVRKEAALKKLLESALYTGSGEFIELISGAKKIGGITKNEIYKIYDLKTANYTFSAPLTIGATLAGANLRQNEILSDYGLYIGRAFQIKDDVIGIYSDEAEIGKSNLTDLQESKKTLLIWYAYRRSRPKGRRAIEKILSKEKVNHKDLKEIREIISDCGALGQIKEEVISLINKANCRLESSEILPQYKKSLRLYSQELLKL